MHAHAAAVQAVGAVVLRLGVQLQLGGSHKALGIDGGAIFPHEAFAEGILPGAAFGALLNAPLFADIIGGHVFRLAHHHGRNHGVAILVLVVIELEEAIGQPPHHVIVIGSGLVLMGVPVGGEGGQRIVISITRPRLTARLRQGHAAEKQAQRKRESKHFLHEIFLLYNFRVHNAANGYFIIESAKKDVKPEFPSNVRKSDMFHPISSPRGAKTGTSLGYFLGLERL